ncbi:type IV pilin protein [Microcystis aeruginosa]|uniref:type IV pilin protein n=1 Tax=Microcystis aeruginosa TaxID=1126 RepID=UPI001230DA49|nr:type IV pilin-like G/H family protein [Microcystis aeruginosa]GCA84130.1 type II secretion system protein G [Microcystis aeruginosa NIES-2522]GCA87762.1 type II secretion system protein G [Microcystis aeruginosa NIES-4264]
MNSTFKFKLIQALNKKNRNKGFTLIELLVVVIIIGVLAAIALPNLLGQVAKGRQAEARTNLAAINRAQQAYRLERSTFATFSTDPAAAPEDNQLPITIQPQYYDYAQDGAPTATGSITNATAQTTPEDFSNDIRDYSAAVAQTDAGVFSSIICEADTPDQADAVSAPADAIGACTNGNEVR